jgi:hypothetical protein
MEAVQSGDWKGRLNALFSIWPSSLRPADSDASQSSTAFGAPVLAEEAPTSLVTEYYQPTFRWLTHSKSNDIQVVLLEKPTELHLQFFRRFGPGFRLHGEEGHQIVFDYANFIEKKIADVLCRHSAAFWIHIYRRISPRLSPDHDSKTDRNTIALVRDHVECAIAKYGKLTGRRDLRRASDVSPAGILGGRFINDIRRFFHDKERSDSFVRNVASSDQVVLFEFESRDFLAMYAVEGLAYEYWRAMARLRSLGKGDSLSVQQDGHLAYDPNPALSHLISSYDTRIDRPRGFSAIVGTFLKSDTAIEEHGRSIVAADYDVDGEAALMFSGLAGFQAADIGSVTNFSCHLYNVDSLYESHRFIAEEFAARRGYPLKDYLLAIAALSWRVAAANPRFQKDTGMEWLSVMQLLRRAYAVCDPALQSIAGHVTIYCESLLKCSAEEMASITVTLPKIIADVFLDSPQKQGLISLWTRGPRFLLILGDGFALVDIQGVQQTLTKLFVGIRHSNQARGMSFEEDLRVELSNNGHVLLKREFKFATGPREADAVVRCGDVLWIIEAFSMERPMNYEIGKPSVLQMRNNGLEAKLIQVESLKSLLERQLSGPNYDFRWAARIEHCVVSPFVEWIWSTDSRYWIDEQVPRIASVRELMEILSKST